LDENFETGRSQRFCHIDEVPPSTIRAITRAFGLWC
jgi:hypothetical protein